jgi:hypothetical protein
MGFKQEIIFGYSDKYGFVSPQPTTHEDYPSSYNGVMYTSEFIVILVKLGLLTEVDRRWFMAQIGNCTSYETLNRTISWHDAPGGQEGPDDYYGLMNACKHIGDESFPKRFLASLLSDLGCLNNVNPGQFTFKSFLARQPQLVAAMVAAAYPKATIKDKLLRLLAFPLFLYSAIIIATSCIRAPRQDTDARRLSWHLIQTVSPVSALCRLASKLWYKRLYKTYPNGMKEVASLYYSLGHPFLSIG